MINEFTPVRSGRDRLRAARLRGQGEAASACARWRPPQVLGLAVALGLSACGGGGGGTVKPSTPPSGSGVPVEPATVYVKSGATLFVKAGEVSKPVKMDSASKLDNAGVVGGPTLDIGVMAERDVGSNEVFNHDGGRIEGKQFGVRFQGSAPIIKNAGSGTLIQSDGVAIEYTTQGGQDGFITNVDGATIRGGSTALRVRPDVRIFNGAGSTIEVTGTKTGDCGAGGSCSIYVAPYTNDSPYTTGTRLENAGTIFGNVQLDTTRINEVTLWAGGRIVGDLSMGPGQLKLNGEAGTIQQFSQAITGSMDYRGYVQKYGDGAWILDTAMPLTKDGDPTSLSASIYGGTLQIGDGGTEGPDWLGPVQAYYPGRLRFNRSDDFVFDSGFSGGGVIEQAGTGLLTLSLSPDWLHEIGTLVIDPGARVDVVRADSRANVENDGELTFRIADASDSYWSGSMSGSGSLVKDGTSFLTLAGATTYTGDTIVNAGRFSLRQGLPGDVRINNAGTFLAGTSDMIDYVPSIGGSLYNAGRVELSQGDVNIWGVLAPAGDYHVGGDYLQASTATFAVTLGDKLDIAGKATIDGGVLEILGAANGYVANDHTDVLTAGAGVVGTFDTLMVRESVVFLDTTIHYGPNSVWLDTTGLDVTTAAEGQGVGYTPSSMASAQRVQGAFDRINAGRASGASVEVSGEFLEAAGRFQRAPSIARAQASLRSLSGELHAASAAMSLRAIEAGNRVLSGRLVDLREGTTRTGSWSRELGGSGESARNGYSALGFELDGWLVGRDYRAGDSGLIGFAFGQGRGRQESMHGVDRDDSRRSEGMLYAGSVRGSWYSLGRLGFGQVRQDAARQLLLGRAFEGVWTRYQSDYQVAYVERGFSVGRGSDHLASFLNLEYARTRRDDFSEQGGAGFGLRSGPQAADRWQAGAGVRFGRGWRFGNGRSVTLAGHAEWRHTLASSGRPGDASFVGVEEWAPLVGIEPSRFGRVLGLKFEARLSPSTTFGFAYDDENWQFETAQRWSARWKTTF